MAALQIFDKLLQFPLFQGMSRDDLEIVAGHTRFGFLKLAAGKTVMKSGDACHQLYFLINGSMKVRSFADDYGYHVEEQIAAPYIIQLESVFGYYQRYTRDFIAQTDVNFLTIDKEEVVRLTEDFLVFRHKEPPIIIVRSGRSWKAPGRKDRPHCSRARSCWASNSRGSWRPGRDRRTRTAPGTKGSLS